MELFSLPHQIYVPVPPLVSLHWDQIEETEVPKNEQGISQVHVKQQAQDDPVKLKQ